MTTAFSCAAHGRMKLNRSDYYQGDESNVPCLEIEYRSDDNKTRTVVSDGTRGEISRDFTVFCISNPVYAKPTGRNMGRYSSHTADLFIQDVEVCKIPDKCSLNYRFKGIRQRLGRGTPNLGEFFSSVKGLEFVIGYAQVIDRCIKQSRIQQILGSVTSDNVSTYMASLEGHPLVSQMLTSLIEEYQLSREDAIRYLIQIIEIVKNEGIQTVKSAWEWLVYQQRKAAVDERLSDFNTTGLDLRASKFRGALTISFGRAGRMSNGERDVLFFVASLVAFESMMNKKPAILIMDEVFDYLDGANLLAAQYYLSKIFEIIKGNNKTVVPIIMTHLDPAVFSTYRFKKMAVHYLTNKSKIYLSDYVVKLLFLRGNMNRNNHPACNDLEKHMLHYHPDNWTIPDEVKSELPDDFWPDSESFRQYVYSEVQDKYLKELDYNALAVIIGLRIKVEEKTVALIPEDRREEYYDKHGSKEKLEYVAEECACDVPELFYLLQPLYNDAAHLRDSGAGHEQETRNKIESAYLKVSSKIIKGMIREVFC